MAKSTQTKRRRCIGGFEKLEARRVLDSTVVFNELMYNPIGATDGDLEWVEFYNQLNVDVDMSEWVVDGGIRFTFPDRTIIPARSYLVIAANPDVANAQQDFPESLGPWEGRLSNGGEELRLYNNDNRLMNAIDYRDGGSWPVAPDGGGPSLSKMDQQSASHIAENWTFSQRVGGSPGVENFIRPGTFFFKNLVPEDSAATAFVPTDDRLGKAWIDAAFDDSEWLHGTTGVGHEGGRSGVYNPFLGLDLDAPPDGQEPMPLADVNSSVYIRVPFDLADGASFDALELAMRYDDAFIAYLNGVEVVRSDNVPDEASWNSAATGTNRDSNAQLFKAFPIHEHVGLLNPGTNVLAIHGLNRRISDNDSLFEPVLRGGNEVETDIPIPLRINEVAPANADDFFVEIRSIGQEPVDLSPLKLLNRGATTNEFEFSVQTLGPGQVMSVDVSQLGFRPGDNDYLGLFTKDGKRAVDAQRVTGQLRGHSDELGGRWSYPSSPTPGQPNQFQLNRDVVINEIMYHAPPKLAQPDTPPTFSRNPLIEFDSVWRYNNSGADLGTDWASRVYAVDGATWHEGPTAIGFETTELTVPLRTEIGRPSLNDPRFVTYYFQTEFEMTAESLSLADAIEFRHMVDDGAVFYLNGTEFSRFNIDPGPVDANTDTSRSTLNAEILGPLRIDPSLLQVGTNVISVEVHISTPASNDVFFAADLSWGEMLTPFVPGTPYRQNPEEWIELYNKGPQPVDLSDWRVRDGVTFDFTDGTTINPGEYVILANDPGTFSAKYPDARVVGHLQGTLGNHDDRIQLIDAAGNLADEVHYYEGGSWSELADGGGSSLELRSPHADNSKGDVWTASSPPVAPWTDHSFIGYSRVDALGGKARFNEFVFGLLDQGEFLIDDVEVIESPSTDALPLIQNGTFEDDVVGQAPAKWRILGTHRGTVIADPEDPDNQVLRVTATGAQQFISDYASTTFVNDHDVVDGFEYEIRFRVKWLAGSAQLHNRLYFNRVANTARMNVPDRIGTPGAVNSTIVDNVGPTFEGLRHSPTVPAENESVTVTLDRADDPDGVSSVKLWWRKDGAEWSMADMASASGSFSGTIPGYEEGDVVQFYIEATDGKGTTSMFPAGGPHSRALYQVEPGEDLTPRSDIDRYLMVMLDEDADRLVPTTDGNHTANMTNQFQPLTLIHNDTAYYDVGVRQIGSRWIRPNSGYKLAMNPDEPFYGIHDSIRFDTNGLVEIVMKQMTNRAGFGKNSAYDDIAFLVSPQSRLSHEVLVQLARFEDGFLQEQFGETGGTKYELDDVVFPSRPPSDDPEGIKSYADVFMMADIGFDTRAVELQGDNPEFYRAHVLIKSNRARDDYASIARLGQAIHKSGQELFEATNEVMDVDLWMRHYANQAYLGNWDSYGFDRPKNLRIYARESDGKFVPFFWDCDLCNLNEPIIQRTEPTSRLDEIRDIPHNLRLYWGHMLDMINRSFNREYVTYWAQHYGAKAANQSHGGQRSFADFAANTAGRTSQALIAIRDAIPKVDFQITTNGGKPLTTDSQTVQLQGKGWIDIRTLRLAGSERSLDVFWPETDTWQINLPVSLGENTFTLEARGFEGDVIATDEIVVTSTVKNPAVSSLRITEVNYHPSRLLGSEVAAGVSDSDDFEFIELTNVGDATISLDGIELVQTDDQQGVAFRFDASTSSISELAPGARVVVVENETAFGVRYPDVQIAGAWQGGLANSSETITLAYLGVAIQQFTYHDTWYPTTDGGGSTLVIVDPSAASAELSKKEAWRPSPMLGGSPGTDSIAPGDANGDGIFSSEDLVLVSQAGEYEDDTNGNSTFFEGDWNGDGDFTSLDLVFAFTTTGFTVAETAARRNPT